MPVDFRQLLTFRLRRISTVNCCILSPEIPHGFGRANKLQLSGRNLFANVEPFPAYRWRFLQGADHPK